MSLPVLAALVLAGALVLRLGLAVMRWPYEAVASQAAHAESAGRSSHEVDLAAVQSLKLFGANNAAQSGAGVTAKVATTDLDLSLEGVVLASEGKDSLAFIISNGQQHSYKSGDTLPVAAAVTLGGIAKDHVLIRNNGIEQALWLYDPNHRPPAAKAATNNSKARVQSAAAGNSGSPAAQVQQTAPTQIRKVAAARLAEIFEVTPETPNGQLSGYRLTPGARLKDFVQLGFKTNDILTSINGIALNDKANLPELYSLMNKPGDVSFSLLRNGQPLALQVTMAP